MPGNGVDDTKIEDKVLICIGDSVFVHPGEIVSNGKAKREPSEDVWLAKILDIRAKGSERVFLQIAWYYSLQQLEQVKYPHRRVRRLDALLSTHLTLYSLAANSSTCSRPRPTGESLFYLLTKTTSRS